MAIAIKEYLGSMPKTEIGHNAPFSLNESMNALTVISKDSIMVDIEGIHVGPTRNYTWYTEQALRGSVPSWTKPYESPLILHHNEVDGKTIGRILEVKYTDINTRSKTGALIFTCNVADEDGKKGVKDGRLKTTSIGVMATDVRCSICGHIISEHGECEHERGNVYDGETCYWMIYAMEAKELSYVIVPSDKYAHNIRIYSPQIYSNNLTEKMNTKEGEREMTIKAEPKKEDIVAEKQLAEANKTLIVEDAEKEIKKEEPKTIDREELIKKLKKTIEDLKQQLEESDLKLKKEIKTRESAEEELITANTMLKELAIEHVLYLREKLERPALIKETLMKRSNESLMDSVADLKEELGIINGASVNLAEESSNTKVVNLTESKIEEVKEDNSQNVVGSIEKPVTEALVDESRDFISKKEEKNNLDVKEGTEESNTIYEVDLDEQFSKIYGI